MLNNLLMHIRTIFFGFTHCEGLKLSGALNLGENLMLLINIHVIFIVHFFH